MRPHLFPDTEWANDVTRELVSLAITNADGSCRFYAERDALPSVPSTSVSKGVFPLLERGSAALDDIAFGIALRSYINGFSNPVIHFDALLDRTLLRRALSGSGHLDDEVMPVETKLVTRTDVLERLEMYFSANPAAPTSDDRHAL